MFSIKTRDIPCLPTYAAALARWEQTKPWRGYMDHVRPLADWKHKHKAIVRRGDDIACRLYPTDVVTYRPDGSIVLRGYSSASTNAFARAVLPFELNVDFVGARNYLVIVRQKAYQFAGEVRMIRVDDEWRPDHIMPFRSPRLNTKRAAAARRDSRFNEFVLWLRAVEALDEKRGWFGGIVLPDNVCNLLLAGPPGWRELREGGASPNEIRDAVYQHYQCLDIEMLDWVEWGRVRAVEQRQRRWGL